MHFLLLIWHRWLPNSTQIGESMKRSCPNWLSLPQLINRSTCPWALDSAAAVGLALNCRPARRPLWQRWISSHPRIQVAATRWDPWVCRVWRLGDGTWECTPKLGFNLSISFGMRGLAILVILGLWDIFSRHSMAFLAFSFPAQVIACLDHCCSVGQHISFVMLPPKNIQETYKLRNHNLV